MIRHLLQIGLVLLFQLIMTGSATASDNCTYKGKPVTGNLMESLHHGVNLPDWWEPSPHNHFTDKDFQHIKSMGFDFVRVPITPDWLEIQDAQEQARTLEKLHCDLSSILNSDLAIVLDMHPGGQAREVINQLPQDKLEVHLQKLWKSIAPALDGLPQSRIALQLLNEPEPELRHYWWDVQEKLVAAMRKVYPQHLLIVSSIQNGPWDYKGRQPYTDTNLMYDFHFYQPMFLTHHGAEWIKSPDSAEQHDHIEYPSVNVAIPADATTKMKKYVREGWDKEKLADEMASFFTWSRKYNVKPICLEFGVYRAHVDAKARFHWLHDVREILDEHGIAWAVWEYNEGFGILETDRDIDREIRSSLGLTPVSHQSTP